MADQTSNKPVRVFNPYDEPETIDEKDLPVALKGGYRVASPEDIADYQAKETYGKGTANELKAAALGAAGAFSFGLIPEALAQSGAVPSAEQAALAKHNPSARIAGEVAGVGAGVLGAILTGGGSAAATAGAAGSSAAARAARVGIADVLNPISGVSKLGKAVSSRAARALPNPETASFTKAVLARAGATAAGSAVEGALFGAGMSIDEHAMGDPEAFGEHLLHNIGYGAAMAGIAGGGLSAAGDLFGKLKTTVKDWRNPGNKAEGIRENIREGAAHEANIPGAELVPEGEALPGAPVPGQVPTSLQDIQAKVKSAGYQGLQPGELPAKALLKESDDLVGKELEFPVHGIQYESLSDPRARDYYKTLLESQTDEALQLRNYEALQKHDLSNKLSSEVQKIAPTEALTSDATKGGESLVEGFTGHYQAEKKALKPFFEEFDKIGVNPLENFAARPAPLDDAIEGASQYLVAKDGKLLLQPYKPSMPFSKAAHGAMEDIIDAANDPKMTLDGIRNVRDAIKDRIKMDSSPRERAQLEGLRKTLMDYMQEAIEQHSDDLNVRETFKRYAINEQNRSVMEKVFGGSVSDRATFGKLIKSEDVLEKLFSNSVTVQAAKDILPANVFNKAVGDYLSMKKAAFTDAAKNGFSSFKFATFLRSKEPELMAALAENPQALARMKAFTDIMRILPDSPSINPSGTAKTLNMMEVINKVGSILHPISSAKELAGAGLQGFANRSESKRVASVLDEVLKGKNLKEAEAAAEGHMARNTILGMIKKASIDTAKAIEKGAKFIFGGAAVPAAAAGAAKKESDRKKMFEDLHSFNADPTSILDKLNGHTQLIYAHAPESTGALNQSILRANQFLASKLPKLPPPTPLGPKFEPSKADIAKFERYAAVVDEPLSVMKNIKSGTVTPESMEALSTVYPKLLEQMRVAVVGELADHASKEGKIPYATKLGLSLFLGQPMDATLTQSAIMAHQPMPAPPPSPPAGGKKKGALSKLGKSATLYATGDQASQMEDAKHAS